MSGSSHAPGRGFGSRMGLTAVAAGGFLAVLVGTLAPLRAAAATAVATGVFVAGLLCATARRSGRSITVEISGKSFLWLSLAWVVVLLRPLGAETIYEDLAHAAIGVAAVASLKRNGLVGSSPWPLLALPACTLVSVAWSLAPKLALLGALELFVIVLLATLTMGIVRAEPSLGRMVIGRTLRGLVLGVAVLCVVGLVYGNPKLPTLFGAEARFSWIGSNPVAAAASIGAAFLVLIFGRRETKFSLPTTAVLVVLFSACLYLGKTRTAIVALTLAVLIGYWIASRGRPAIPRLAGGVVIAIVVFFVAAQFGASITDYLYRGETQQQVFALNGRIPLWAIGVRQIHTPLQWLVGFGEGSTSVLFKNDARWAGDAHSAWLELLLSFGLVGIAVGLSVVAFVGIRLFRHPPGMPIMAILFVYLLAMSPVGGGYGIPGPGPGLGFGTLVLCYAAESAPRLRKPQRVIANRVRMGPELEPAPT